MNWRERTRTVFFRLLLLIGVSTVVLTASFVGVLAFATGSTAGIGNRLPFYVVALGLLFVGSIVFLDQQADTTGRAVLVTTVIVSLLLTVFIALSSEGVLYASGNPDEVFVSQLVWYLAAAGLICTGLAYWTLKYWREVTGQHHLR